MHRLIGIFITLGICLGISQPARGSQEIHFSTPEVAYRFGEQLTIETGFESEASIQTMQVVLQPVTSDPFTGGETTLESNQVSYHLDLSQNQLPLFSEIEYWYEGTFENGASFTSQHFTFFYQDNRFEWQSLSNDEFEIFWYQQDDDFGQEVLEAANQSLERIRSNVDVSVSQQVAFYVYSKSQEMQSALQSTDQTSTRIAGHTDPALGFSLVSIAANASQSLEIKRQIPHELTHLLLYQKLGPDYAYLPRWLNEGLATISELSPNPDYPLLLDRAYQRDQLLPLVSLCNSFPNEAATFQLAYAQASSFTRYLQTEFGNERIEDLLGAYGEGVTCQQGTEAALEKSLTELERDWRQVTFGESAILAALQSLGPWLLIFLVTLASTLGLAFLGKDRNE